HDALPIFPVAHGAGPDAARLLRRPGDGEPGGRRQPARVRGGHRHRLRHGGAGRADVRDALVLRPGHRPVPADLRVRGGRDRRPRPALGHAAGRHPRLRRRAGLPAAGPARGTDRMTLSNLLTERAAANVDVRRAARTSKLSGGALLAAVVLLAALPYVVFSDVTDTLVNLYV